MKENRSVFLFNIGIHYSRSLNLTTYQRLIDSVIKMLKQDSGTGDENRTQSSETLSIWRSSTAIEAENFGKTFWGENLTEWRFHNNPVSQELPKKVYHKLPFINPGHMHLFLRSLRGAYKRRKYYPRGLLTGIEKPLRKKAIAVLITTRFAVKWNEIINRIHFNTFGWGGTYIRGLLRIGWVFLFTGRWVYNFGGGGGGAAYKFGAYKYQFMVLLKRIFLDVSWKIELEKKKVVSSLITSFPWSVKQQYFMVW